MQHWLLVEIDVGQCVESIKNQFDVFAFQGCRVNLQVGSILPIG